MKIIRESNSQIMKILYNQLYVYGNCFDQYIDSPYVHEYEYNNYKYVYNLLTDEIIQLDISEDLSDEFKVKKWYKIYKDLDPYTVASIGVKLNFAKLRTNLSPIETRNFTILTTTGCNARCEYCFEKGRLFHSMSDSTALDVAKYLTNLYVDKTIGICWFGGEPTIHTKPIDIICDYLRKNNIPFYSSFITNGSKIKDIDFYKLIHKWRVSDVQITLDGLYNDHDNIKKFVDGSSFDDIKNGLDLLANSNIQVGLRINITPYEDDFKRKLKLALWIVDNFGDKENFLVNTSTLYDTENLKFSKEDRDIMYNYNDKVRSILRQSPLYRRNSFLPSPYRDISSCVVQSRDGITIDTFGNIQMCQYYTEPDTAIGHVNTGYTNLDIVKYSGAQKLQKECKYCKHYPICQYLEICKSSGTCSTLSVYNMDRNVNEFIRNIVDEVQQ